MTHLLMLTPLLGTMFLGLIVAAFLWALALVIMDNAEGHTPAPAGSSRR